MASGPPSVTYWITALSTLVLGVVGALFGIYQWWMAGFRPKVAAYLETGRERVVVTVENRGRGSGVVYAVDVVAGPSPDQPIVPSSIVADPEMSVFPQTVLNPGGAIQVVRKAELAAGQQKSADGGLKFPAGVQVLVRMSVKAGCKIVAPAESSNLSLAGTFTQLPPSK